MALHFPKTVWIVPTTRCNTRCRICSHFDSDYGEDMSEEVFAKVESEVLDHVRRVHLVGGGEPLISKIFPQMLDACIRRKIKIFFITNTIALNEELLRVLVPNDAEIMVSIDGATAETYNSIRPFIRFERLLDKLQLIKDIRKEYPNNNFKLYTNSVIMKRNLHELSQLVELAHKYSVDSAVFSDYIHPNMHTDFDGEQPALHPDLIRANVPQAMALAKRYKLNHEMPHHYHTMSFPAPTGEGPSAGSPGNGPEACPQDGAYASKDFVFPQKCQLPWTHSNILVNGNVTTCCTDGLALGNVLEESFSSIWNGQRYQETRELIRTNNPPANCKHCNLGAGIAAGNPSFFPQFLKDNHMRSLAPDGPHVRFSRPLADGGGVLPAGLTELEVDAGDAEFLAIRASAAPNVRGKVMVQGRSHAFKLEDPTVLVPLTRAEDGRPTRLGLELSSPVRVHGFDLLNYTHKAVMVVGTRLHNARGKFQEPIALIKTRLAAALGKNPRLKSFVVFGANAFGSALGQVGLENGLTFSGFMDNYVDYFDEVAVLEPDELPRLKPDVVLIASVGNAQAIATQVRGLADHAPVIITGRD